MKNKKQQVEELAKERNEIRNIMKILDRCSSINPMYQAEVASIIYWNDYRKIDKDSVVLSKERYDYLTVWFDKFTEIMEDVEKLASKETAQKIFIVLLKEFDKRKSCGNADVVVYELARQFGIEIKE